MPDISLGIMKESLNVVIDFEVLLMLYTLPIILATSCLVIYSFGDNKVSGVIYPAANAIWNRKCKCRFNR